MEQWLIWAVLGISFVVIIIIQAISGNKKPIQSALGSMVLGIIALMAVNICGNFTSVTLPISTLSVSIAAIGGIPGVTLMLLLNMFF
ncbi:MAG TPA: transcriptional regulator [Clostridiales bacterium]|nr:transcriptional regulator [Clostridiales bacterium]